MANKDLKTAPHSIGKHEDSWWYEDPGGVCVVIEAYSGRGEVQTKHRTIPWRSIKAALARKER